MRPEDWDRAYAAAAVEWSVQPHPHMVGCGEGRQAIWLASCGWDVTAVDFSAVAIDRGRRIAKRHGVVVDWVVGDVIEYQVPSPIDLAVLLYLHLPADDLAAVVGRTAVALGPGGTLFVLGWDRQNAVLGTGGPRPTEVLYTVEGLVRAANGLEVVRAERVPQAGSPDAVDTLLTARRGEDTDWCEPPGVGDRRAPPSTNNSIRTVV